MTTTGGAPSAEFDGRTLAELLAWRIAQNPEAVAVRRRRDGWWHEYSWTEAGDQVSAIAAGLRARGVVHGARVLLLGEIDLEMLWTTYAAWTLGAATVSVWPGGGTEDVAQVVGDTQPTVAVVRGAREVGQLLALADTKAPAVIVSWEDDCTDRSSPDVDVLTFDQLVSDGRSAPPAAAVMLKPGDVTSMFRTSGSTGVPKLAAHTHTSLIEGTRAFLRAFPADAADDHIPNFNLAAPAEPVVGTVSHLLSGMRLNFTASRTSYDEDVKDLSPHYMWLMPYQWEARVNALDRPGQTLSVDELRHELGLHNTRWAITGGYAIAPAAAAWLAGLGVELHKIYASAEMLIVGSGLSTGDQQAVGRLLPEVGYEVRNGELFIRWPGLFTGYWGRSDALQDGWYPTGDLVEVDPDREVRILGRAQFVAAGPAATAHAPEAVEARLRSLAYLQDAFCLPVEDGGVIALVTFRVDQATDRLESDVAAINEDLTGRPIRTVAVLRRNFDFDRGELTPTGKLRRGGLQENFADVIETARSGGLPGGPEVLLAFDRDGG